MNKEEFCLSDYEQDTNKATDFKKYAYSKEAIKEFIKRLKEELFNLDASSPLFLKIDKLAGPKLT